jgi:hypothetical protein
MQQPQPMQQSQPMYPPQQPQHMQQLQPMYPPQQPQSMYPQQQPMYSQQQQPMYSQPMYPQPMYQQPYNYQQQSSGLGALLGLVIIAVITAAVIYYVLTKDEKPANSSPQSNPSANTSYNPSYIQPPQPPPAASQDGKWSDWRYDPADSNINLFCGGSIKRTRTCEGKIGTGKTCVKKENVHEFTGTDEPDSRYSLSTDGSMEVIPIGPLCSDVKRDDLTGNWDTVDFNKTDPWGKQWETLRLVMSQTNFAGNGSDWVEYSLLLNGKDSGLPKFYFKVPTDILPKGQFLAVNGNDKTLHKFTITDSGMLRMEAGADFWRIDNQMKKSGGLVAKQLEDMGVVFD